MDRASRLAPIGFLRIYFEKKRNSAAVRFDTLADQFWNLRKRACCKTINASGRSDDLGVIVDVLRDHRLNSARAVERHAFRGVVFHQAIVIESRRLSLLLSGGDTHFSNRRFGQLGIWLQPDQVSLASGCPSPVMKYRPVRIAEGTCHHPIALTASGELS